MASAPGREEDGPPRGRPWGGSQRVRWPGRSSGEACGAEIVAWVDQVGSIHATVDDATVDRAAVDAHPTRCPDPAAAAAMESLIRAVRKDGDTIGGVVRCVVRGVPAGLGAPVFDKLEAELAKAMMSLPAAKGFSRVRGSTVL